MDRDPIALWDAEAATFDQAADHGLTDARTRAAWRALFETALPHAPARIADLGCGTGTLSLLLAEMGYRVDGVDFSPRMLEQAIVKAEGRADVAFRVGDAGAPPLRAGSYEVVICRHVLWALSEPAEALKRWAALLILTRTGRMVLVEGRWHRRGADQTRALLAKAGRQATFADLGDSRLWDQKMTDERYMLVSTR